MMQELYVDNTILQGILSHFYIKNSMLSVLKLFIFLWLYICVYDLHVWVEMHTCQGTCTGTCMWKSGQSEDNAVELFISFHSYMVPEIKLSSSSWYNEHSVHRAITLDPMSLSYCPFLIQPVIFPD